MHVTNKKLVCAAKKPVSVDLTTIPERVTKSLREPRHLLLEAKSCLLQFLPGPRKASTQVLDWRRAESKPNPLLLLIQARLGSIALGLRTPIQRPPPATPPQGKMASANRFLGGSFQLIWKENENQEQILSMHTHELWEIVPPSK